MSKAGPLFIRLQGLAFDPLIEIMIATGIFVEFLIRSSTQGFRDSIPGGSSLFGREPGSTLYSWAKGLCSVLSQGDFQ